MTIRVKERIEERKEGGGGSEEGKVN